MLTKLVSGITARLKQTSTSNGLGENLAASITPPQIRTPSCPPPAHLAVEPDGLLGEALLPFDVGQVVQTVGVRGHQPERRVVALLGLGDQALLLERVGQVAVGVREVGLQLDGVTVRVDGQVNQAAGRT